MQFRKINPSLSAVSLALLCSLAPVPSMASVVVNQASLDGDTIISQVFPDFPAFSTRAYDDFSTAQAFAVTSLTVFGSEAGSPAFNLAVTGEIWNGLPGTGSLVMSSVAGLELGSNLNIDFGGQSLAAGSYWITAYVTRPFSGGGQWFWATHLPITGSQAFVHNPGGGLGFGTNPVPISSVAGPPRDLAFILEGNALASVPEPGSLALFCLAAIVGVGASSRRRAKVQG